MISMEALEKKLAEYEAQLEEQIHARDLALINISRIQGAMAAIKGLIVGAAESPAPESEM